MIFKHFLLMCLFIFSNCQWYNEFAQCSVVDATFSFNPQTDTTVEISVIVEGRFWGSNYGGDSLLSRYTGVVIGGAILGTDFWQNVEGLVSNSMVYLIAGPGGRIPIPKDHYNPTVLQVYGRAQHNTWGVAQCWGKITLIPLASSPNPNNPSNPTNPDNPINPIDPIWPNQPSEPTFQPTYQAIYRYSAIQSNGLRFNFSPNPNYGYGWKFEGIAFWGPQNDPQAVPVYSYWYDQSWSYGGYRYYFSVQVDPQKDPTLLGWNFVGIAFYAYQFQKENTVPVYQYHADQKDGKRFHFSTGQKPGKEGWIKDKIAFYAYPADLE